MMSTFPTTEPNIEIARLGETPFEAECRELRWWFIVPEPGRSRRWAFYYYPARRLSSVEEMVTLETGKIHGEECCEMRYRSHTPEGTLQREAYAYGAIREGIANWYAWWHLDDAQKLYTWRDEDFQHDWASAPVRTADMGFFHWEADDRLVKDPRPWADPQVNPIGAGLWLLRIGSQEHRCLRIIEADDPGDEGGILLEGFLDESGRVLLSRRYNGPRYRIDGKESQEVLAGHPTLTCNGIPYSLWYDCLPEDGL
jgi:hypothetical protein